MNSQIPETRKSNHAATGPPQSGAGVGVGMLRGTRDPLLEYFLDLEIYQDSTNVKFVFY